MRSLRPALALALALLAGAAAALDPVETEPNGFTVPGPQSLGTLGEAGLSVSGTIDPTSPSGLSPGDDDGFSFLAGTAGPFRATVDGAGGITFVLALAETTASGTVLRAAVLGPAPLVLARPSLTEGAVFRVGVTALGDGDAVPYALHLDPAAGLPPWTGETCGAPSPESEPNEFPAAATDLGWFDGGLCASGEVAVVSPPDSGIEGDVDWFRFRNVLPVPATLMVAADPGTVDVEVDRLLFVGPGTVAAATFGEAVSLGLPVLEPGADYLVRISARSGTAPVRYSFSLDPSGPPPKPPADPLAIVRATLKLPPDPARGRFSLRASFEEGLGTFLDDGTPVTLRLRGGEAALASGKLALDALGRLAWKAPRGLDGIRFFRFDPYEGTVRIEGKGVDLAGEVDPADPAIDVEIDFGDLRLEGSAEGAFTRKGRVLRAR